MKKILSIAVLGGCLTIATTAFSAEVDFKGNFLHDNEVLRFDFSVALPGVVTLFSSSWDDGGFDPILAIWDSAGNQIVEQDDEQDDDDSKVGGSRLSNSVLYDYGEFDSFLNIDLDASDYIATLTQYDNFSVSTLLADGFRWDADPLFTAAFGCSNGSFCEGSLVDSNDNPVEPNRTSAWELHFLNVDNANLNTVPEPSGLILVGLAGLTLVGGRKCKI